MRKFIAAGLAALTFAGAAGSGAAMAQPRWRGHERHERHERWRGRGHNSGAALAAGIAGLAIGAALADGGHGRYVDGYYYGPPRYAYRYYYGPGYDGARHCRTRWMWDPYVGDYVERTRCW